MSCGLSASFASFAFASLASFASFAFASLASFAFRFTNPPPFTANSPPFIAPAFAALPLASTIGIGAFI